MVWWGSWEEAGKMDVPFAPTRILFWVLFLRKRLTRPQGNWISRVSDLCWQGFGCQAADLEVRRANLV